MIRPITNPRPQMKSKRFDSRVSSVLLESLDASSSSIHRKEGTQSKYIDSAVMLLPRLCPRWWRDLGVFCLGGNVSSSSLFTWGKATCFFLQKIWPSDLKRLCLCAAGGGCYPTKFKTSLGRHEIGVRSRLPELLLLLWLIVVIPRSTVSSLAGLLTENELFSLE